MEGFIMIINNNNEGKFMKKIYAIIIFCFLLSACATPYQPFQFNQGYKNFQLNKTTYKVMFKGNGYTSQDLTNQYALRRSAEIALKHGYKYFYVLNSNVEDFKSSFTVPGSSRTDREAQGWGYNASEDDYTTYIPPQTQNINFYEAELIIRLTNRRTPNTYNADIILNQYKTKRKESIKEVKNT